MNNRHLGLDNRRRESAWELKSLKTVSNGASITASKNDQEKLSRNSLGSFAWETVLIQRRTQYGFRRGEKIARNQKEKRFALKIYSKLFLLYFIMDFELKEIFN